MILISIYLMAYCLQIASAKFVLQSGKHHSNRHMHLVVHIPENRKSGATVTVECLDSTNRWAEPPELLFEQLHYLDFTPYTVLSINTDMYDIQRSFHEYEQHCKHFNISIMDAKGAVIRDTTSVCERGLIPNPDFNWNTPDNQACIVCEKGKLQVKNECVNATDTSDYYFERGLKRCFKDHFFGRWDVYDWPIEKWDAHKDQWNGGGSLEDISIWQQNNEPTPYWAMVDMGGNTAYNPPGLPAIRPSSQPYGCWPCPSGSFTDKGSDTRNIGFGRDEQRMAWDFEYQQNKGWADKFQISDSNCYSLNLVCTSSTSLSYNSPIQHVACKGYNDNWFAIKTFAMCKAAAEYMGYTDNVVVEQNPMYMPGCSYRNHRLYFNNIGDVSNKVLTQMINESHWVNNTNQPICVHAPRLKPRLAELSQMQQDQFNEMIIHNEELRPSNGHLVGNSGWLYYYTQESVVNDPTFLGWGMPFSYAAVSQSTCETGDDLGICKKGHEIVNYECVPCSNGTFYFDSDTTKHINEEYGQVFDTSKNIAQHSTRRNVKRCKPKYCANNEYIYLDPWPDIQDVDSNYNNLKTRLALYESDTNRIDTMLQELDISESNWQTKTPGLKSWFISNVMSQNIYDKYPFLVNAFEPPDHTTYRCGQCPYGTTNSMGITSSINSPSVKLADVAQFSGCRCPSGHYFSSSSTCERCQAGTSNPANQFNSVCEATRCEENEHVDGNTCVRCPSGKWNVPYDDVRGPDTSCDFVDLPCGEDEHVEQHLCVPCASGLKRIAGDDPKGDNTICCNVGVASALNAKCSNTPTTFETLTCNTGEHVYNTDQGLRCSDCREGTYLSSPNTCVDCDTSTLTYNQRTNHEQIKCHHVKSNNTEILFGSLQKIVACPGDDVLVHWQGTHNIIETETDSCATNDLATGYKRPAYEVSGTEVKFMDNELVAQPGETRFFKSDLHCTANAARFEVSCPSIGSIQQLTCTANFDQNNEFDEDGNVVPVGPVAKCNKCAANFERILDKNLEIICIPQCEPNPRGSDGNFSKTTERWAYSKCVERCTDSGDLFMGSVQGLEDYLENKRNELSYGGLLGGVQSKDGTCLCPEGLLAYHNDAKGKYCDCPHGFTFDSLTMVEMQHRESGDWNTSSTYNVFGRIQNGIDSCRPILYGSVPNVDAAGNYSTESPNTPCSTHRQSGCPCPNGTEWIMPIGTAIINEQNSVGFCGLRLGAACGNGTVVLKHEKNMAVCGCPPGLKATANGCDPCPIDLGSNVALGLNEQCGCSLGTRPKEFNHSAWKQTFLDKNDQLIQQGYGRVQNYGTVNFQTDYDFRINLVFCRSCTPNEGGHVTCMERSQYRYNGGGVVQDDGPCIRYAQNGFSVCGCSTSAFWADGECRCPTSGFTKTSSTTCELDSNYVLYPSPSKPTPLMSSDRFMLPESNNIYSGFGPYTGIIFGTIIRPTGIQSSQICRSGYKEWYLGKTRVAPMLYFDNPLYKCCPKLPEPNEDNQDMVNAVCPFGDNDGVKEYGVFMDQMDQDELYAGRSPPSIPNINIKKLDYTYQQNGKAPQALKCDSTYPFFECDSRCVSSGSDRISCTTKLGFIDTNNGSEIFPGSQKIKCSTEMAELITNTNNCNCPLHSKWNGTSCICAVHTGFGTLFQPDQETMENGICTCANSDFVLHSSGQFCPPGMLFVQSENTCYQSPEMYRYIKHYDDRVPHYVGKNPFITARIFPRKYEAEPQCFTVTIGSSESNSKSVNTNEASGFSCPSIVNKHNWLTTTNSGNIVDYSDTFSITVSGSQVQATRTGGTQYWGDLWRWNLQISCCYPLPTENYMCGCPTNKGFDGTGCVSCGQNEVVNQNTSLCECQQGYVRHTESLVCINTCNTIFHNEYFEDKCIQTVADSSFDQSTGITTCNAGYVDSLWTPVDLVSSSLSSIQSAVDDEPGTVWRMNGAIGIWDGAKLISSPPQYTDEVVLDNSELLIEKYGIVCTAWDTDSVANGCASGKKWDNDNNFCESCAHGDQCGCPFGEVWDTSGGWPAVFYMGTFTAWDHSWAIDAWGYNDFRLKIIVTQPGTTSQVTNIDFSHQSCATVDECVAHMNSGQLNGITVFNANEEIAIRTNNVGTGIQISVANHEDGPPFWFPTDEDVGDHSVDGGSIPIGCNLCTMETCKCPYGHTWDGNQCVCDAGLFRKCDCGFGKIEHGGICQKVETMPASSLPTCDQLKHLYKTARCWGMDKYKMDTGTKSDLCNLLRIASMKACASANCYDVCTNERRDALDQTRCRCGGSELCEFTEYCYPDNTCNDNPVCLTSDTSALSSICTCGSDTCNAGKYCRTDNTCNDNPRCPASDTSAQSSTCICGSDTCNAGKYCYTDNTCNDNPVCSTTSDVVAQSITCTCGSDTCNAGKYCYPDNTCNDVGKLYDCALYSPLTAPCMCGTDSCDKKYCSRVPFSIDTPTPYTYICGDAHKYLSCANTPNRPSYSYWRKSGPNVACGDGTAFNTNGGNGNCDTVADTDCHACSQLSWAINKAAEGVGTRNRVDHQLCSCGNAICGYIDLCTMKTNTDGTDGGSYCWQRDDISLGYYTSYSEYHTKDPDTPITSAMIDANDPNIYRPQRL